MIYHHISALGRFPSLLRPGNPISSIFLGGRPEQNNLNRTHRAQRSPDKKALCERREHSKRHTSLRGNKTSEHHVCTVMQTIVPDVTSSSVHVRKTRTISVGWALTLAIVFCQPKATKVMTNVERSRAGQV